MVFLSFLCYDTECRKMKSVSSKSKKKGRAFMSLENKKVYSIEEYHNLPNDIRTELIDGQIYYMEPPSRSHQKILEPLFKEIERYLKNKHKNYNVFKSPFSVQLKENENTVVEPDISMICEPEKQINFSYLGAPDWIIEIISSNHASHDYIRKLAHYCDAKVKEYWIVDPDKQSVLVYCFHKEEMDWNAYTFDDVIPVRSVPNFKIDFKKFKR